MKLYAVSYGFGLYVVRAEDEDHACRVAYDGPELADLVTAAGEYEDPSDFNREAFYVLELDAAGPVGILESHFG